MYTSSRIVLYATRQLTLLTLGKRVRIFIQRVVLLAPEIVDRYAVIPALIYRRGAIPGGS